MSIDLINKAIVIRDEVIEGANTAERVGQWMVQAAEELDHFQFIQNSEFLLALTDSEDRILWGIRRDLSPFEGKISTATRRAIIHALKDYTLSGGSSKTLQQLDNETEASQQFKIVTNDEFIYAVVDKNDAILWGIRWNASIYNPSGLKMYDIKTEIKNIYGYLTELFVKDTQPFVKGTTDSDDRILSFIDKEGYFRPQKMKLPRALRNEIKNWNFNDLSNENSIVIAHPRKLAKVFIKDVYSAHLTKEQATRGRIVFYDGVNFFEKIIDVSFQGSSSMGFPKRNFSIDIYNEDGSECFVKIGDWVAVSSFHLKVNFIDALHSRNIVGCRIYEQMVRTREYGEQYIWDVPYDPNNSNLAEQTPSGALGHIDGFPIEIYIQGDYYGLGTWNLTKNRRNYNMSKSDNGLDGNPLHIHIELGGGTTSNSTWASLDWSSFEIRNPSVKNSEGGSYTAGDIPEDSPTKTVIEDFFNWLSSVSDADFKAQAVDKLHINHILDYILLQDMLRNNDSWTRNGQICHYNGKLAVLPYDLDNAHFINGYGFQTTITGVILPLPSTDMSGPFWGRIINLYKDELDARYKELRDDNIFTLKNIEQQYRKIIEVIGIDAYKKDREKWLIPSFRSPDTIIPSEQTTSVNISGGFYTSLNHIIEGMSVRFAMLDEYYNYK